METKNEITVEFVRGERNQVICFIFRGNNTIPMGAGVAYCRAEDAFSEATGEKISLKRALIDGGISKKKRSEIWKDFRADELAGRV